MGIVDGRQAGADVQELADARPGGQVPDGPGEKVPVGAGRADQLRDERENLVPDLPVNGVMILAAQPVIPDPRRMRNRRIDLRRCPRAGRLRASSHDMRPWHERIISIMVTLGPWRVISDAGYLLAARD